jgi:hypothetical protein
VRRGRGGTRTSLSVHSFIARRFQEAWERLD